MIQVKVNGKNEYTIDGNTINGKEVNWDLLEVNGHTFHVLRDGVSYNAVVVNINHEEKTMLVRVNGNDYELSIRDKYDLLMQQLGINTKAGNTVQTIKAPMPGLIIQIAVQAGSEVKKGDTLLILEAMKMENVIKSPRDGKIKTVKAEVRSAVEKNQLLIEFE